MFSMVPSQKYSDILKKYFGHNEFRPLQVKVIESIIEDRRDACIVMATGYGKSLCFQYPPVFCNGLAIVVSPLISLMQDQVESLKMFNIPACHLGSGQKMQKEVIQDLLNNKFRLAYITPEMCSSVKGLEIFEKISESNIKIVLIAIDEAHCVSQWGMDFRKSYRQLSKLRDYFPGVPFLTLTATATLSVRNDIISSLKLKNPLVLSTSFDRPNLFLSASIKGKDILNDIKSLLSKFEMDCRPGSTIIYCPTKKIANNIYELLKGASLNCAIYHADLNISQREKAQKDFADDTVRIMVATIAFGMGIDKPDVRIIIHYGAPKDIETYYQEIGRAGRDGLPSFCHAFYSQNDFALNKYILKNLQGSFRQHKEEMCRIMEGYLQTLECRRRILISHFDPECKLQENSRCCDNCCTTRLPSSYHGADTSSILAEDALLFMKTVNELKGRYGVYVTVLVLRRSSNKRVPKSIYHSKLYGAGINRCEVWWKCLAGLLVRENLLEEYVVNDASGYYKFPVNCLKVSAKGRQYLLENGSKTIVKLEPTQEMRPLLEQIQPRANKDGWVSKGIKEVSVSCTSTAQIRQCSLENKVFDDLIKLRLALASELQSVPYIVLSSKTLQLLAQERPTLLKDLPLIEGFSDSKIEKFGARVIECIKQSISSLSSDDSQSSGKNVKRFVKRVLSYKNDEAKMVEESTSLRKSDDSNPGPITKYLSPISPLDFQDIRSVSSMNEDFYSTIGSPNPVASPTATTVSEAYFTALEDFDGVSSSDCVTDPLESSDVNRTTDKASSVSPQALKTDDNFPSFKRIKLDDISWKKNQKSCETKNVDCDNDSLNYENIQCSKSEFACSEGVNTPAECSQIQSPSMASRIELLKNRKKMIKKKIKI